MKEVKVHIKDNNDIDLYDLLKSLRSLGFPIDKNMISYYSYVNDLYVYCGNDPLQPGTVIPSREVIKENDRLQVIIHFEIIVYSIQKVTLRIRQAASSFQMIGESSAYNADQIKMENQDGAGGQTKQKRTKERKIGQILDKVYTWRKYYSGFTDPQTGQTLKMSLEDAAQKVGISKKSLDDYLLQIR